MKLKVSKDEDGDLGYLSFCKIEAGQVKETRRLSDLVGMYNGPDVYLDFSEDNQLLGIEILE